MTNTDPAKPSPSPPTSATPPPNLEAAPPPPTTEPPRARDKHGRFAQTRPRQIAEKEAACAATTSTPSGVKADDVGVGAQPISQQQRRRVVGE
jgi:hypothetical protein